MDIINLRYVVFMLSPEHTQYLNNCHVEVHDGAVFANRETAKEYAVDAVEKKLCSRFVIGSFLMDMNAEKVYIGECETYGFKHDKKNPRQLSFFK